jgi:hypothetical protein
MSDRVIIAGFAALAAVLVAVVFVYGGQKVVEPTTSELVSRVCDNLGGVKDLKTDGGRLTIICKEKP